MAYVMMTCLAKLPDGEMRIPKDWFQPPPQDGLFTVDVFDVSLADEMHGFETALNMQREYMMRAIRRGDFLTLKVG